MTHPDHGLTLYAIRHKPSGKYLPQPQGRMGRGGSHVEPVRFNGLTETMPRLFPSEKNAKNCLAMWLKGKFETLCFDDDEILKVITQPHRKPEDMEIVPVTIFVPA